MDHPTNLESAVIFRDVERGNTDERAVNWHPKISPYRLWVITTTIGFGTAKAISTRNGNTYIPITLEWIAGTVLVLISFSVSSYETSEDAAPKYLSWLFKTDCMDALWFVLECTFLIKRATYTSKEKAAILHPQRYNPPMTRYRLLVVMTATLFGLSKAKLAHSGQSSAMNWTDWAMAVPVATILYVLGLYEYNDAHLWPSFFVVDRKFGLSVGFKSSFGILFSTTWIVASTYALRYTWQHPEWIGDQPNRKQPAATVTRGLIDISFNHSIRAFSYVMLLGQAFLGVTLLSLTINFLLESMKITLTPIRNSWRKIRRQWVKNIGPIVNAASSRVLEIENPQVGRLFKILKIINHMIRITMKFFAYLFAHLVMLSGCLMLLSIQLGFTVELFDILRVKEWNFLNIGVFMIVALSSGFMFFGLLGMTGMVMYSLFFAWR